MVNQPWLLVALTVLTVARLTRLVTADVLTAPIRERIVRRRLVARGKDDDWLVYLAHCRWCASIWLAFPVAVVVYLWWPYWPVQIGLIALAASHVTALLAGFEDD